MKSKLIVTFSAIIILLVGASQVSLAAPEIVSWGNDATNNAYLNIDNLERLSSVIFNVTANETIDDWYWGNATIISGNGTMDSNATKQFTETGTFYVTIYGKNDTETTDTKMWTITVVDNTPPADVMGLANDTPTQITVNLSWTANTEDDLWGYEVFKNDNHIAYIPKENAYYNVTGLSPSTLYEFKVRANDTTGNWGNNSSSISITTMSAPAPTYTIWGYILNSSDMSPIDGSSVGNDTLGWTSSSESGYYELTGVLNGTYNISASKVGYETNYTIAIVSGSDVGNLNITLTRIPTYSISGYVLNASSGMSVSGATVTNSTLGSNTTDANGYYMLAGAVNGTWRVTATATGYADNYTDAAVSGADLTGVNITLTPVAPSPPQPGALKIIWYSPGAVDYVFVNDTVSETITYMVSTNQQTAEDIWYLDYVLVSNGGQSFTRSWNDSDVGRHVIKYTGKNANGTVSFEWYVNVYNETEIPFEKKGLFEIIDEALSNHVYDIKIRMFEYRVELAPNASEKARLVRERNQLMHDEIAKRQMTREALRKEFKDGKISKDVFVSAMHKVQLEMKNTVKAQKYLEKIEKTEKVKNGNGNQQSKGKGKGKWD